MEIFSPNPRKTHYPRIPNELYQNIFPHVLQSDLLTLCMTSSILRREAEHFLYGDVNLCCRSCEQLLSWGLRMVDRDPRLARLLRVLEFSPRARAHAALASELCRSMFAALTVAVNLVELTVVSYPDEPLFAAIFPDILEHCSFRLRKFHFPEYFRPSDGDSSKFYAQQVDIVNWNPGLSPSDLHSHLFPGLSSVEAMDFNVPLLTFIATRPINRFSIEPKILQNYFILCRDSHALKLLSWIPATMVMGITPPKAGGGLRLRYS